MVGVVIITHNDIGSEILASAEQIMGRKLPKVRSIGIPGNLEPEQLAAYADEIKTVIEEMDSGRGVLIMTDIMGATPDNLAQYFAENHKVRIISGINLPMLVRVINYADKPLELLAKIGIVGANKGITKEIDI